MYLKIKYFMNLFNVEFSDIQFSDTFRFAFLRCYIHIFYIEEVIGSRTSEESSNFPNLSPPRKCCRMRAKHPPVDSHFYSSLTLGGREVGLPCIFV